MAYELELPGLYIDDVAAVAAAGRPILINRHPGPDETGVPVDASVALELVDTGADGIDRGATQVFVGGELVFQGGGAPEFQAGSSGSAEETADALRLVILPAGQFVSLSVVDVRVVSAVNGGGGQLDETYSFAIEDLVAPRVVAAQATAQRYVRIQFDEPVVVTDPAGFAFEALDVPAVPLAPVEAEASGSVVTVRVDTEMSPDVSYRVTASGVEDGFGNAVAPPYDNAVFTGFRPARPAARRFDLWSMLPKYNRRADLTGDLRRFVACLQDVTDLLLAEVDRFPDIFDFERSPGTFLDLILRDLGNPFAFDLEEIERRRLAAVLVEMYRQKGTAAGIRNAARFFLGLDVTITTFTSTTLILGVSELGVDWELGTDNRWARYAFDVHVDRALTEAERRHLRAIVIFMKPAHTHLAHIVEPAAPMTWDHWVLGESELGETTYLR